MKRAGFFLAVIFGVGAVLAAAEEIPEADRRRETVKFGTDAEILGLVTKLEAEKADYLDGELLALLDSTGNPKIKEILFSLFARRKLAGAEKRALRVIAERDEEKRPVVEAAIAYVGALAPKGASESLRDIIEETEGPYLSAAIRALGLSGGKADAEAYGEWISRSV